MSNHPMKQVKQADDPGGIKRRNTTGRFFNATPDTGKRSSQPKVGPNPLPPRPTPRPAQDEPRQ